MSISGIKKKLVHFYYKCEIAIKEKRTLEGVHYIFKNKNSNKLLIVFSGIGGDYNYRRSLSNSSWDQLYIKDSWAEGVSYYLFENGSNHPEELVSSFIDAFLSKRKYKTVVTLGSSKGGTSALYFGLKHKVDEVYSGACQYRIGDYLGIYHEKGGSGYFKNVMGGANIQDGDIYAELGGKQNCIAILNRHMEFMLESRINSQTLIHLLYSTEEHTFDDHIKYLIEKLDECKIKHVDQVEKFPEHSMVGDYMKVVCKNELA